MSSTRVVDINGLQASPGDHVCVFYRGEAERHRIMVQYDIDRFGGNVIIPALRVYPKMLFAGMLLENPYYLDPDEA